MGLYPSPRSTLSRRVGPLPQGERERTTPLELTRQITAFRSTAREPRARTFGRKFRIPELKNPRQELFAQKLAEGMCQTRAYAAAGYRPCQPASSKLGRRPEIQVRRRELLHTSASKMGVTLESLIAKAERTFELAIELDHPYAAVAAIKEMGILSGVRVEKRDSTLPGSSAASSYRVGGEL